jgi:zeta-carotene isomerase
MKVMKVQHAIISCLFSFAGSFTAPSFSRFSVSSKCAASDVVQRVASSRRHVKNEFEPGTMRRTATPRISASLKPNEIQDRTGEATELVGDDSAFFDLQQQSLQEWLFFTAATSSVLAFIAWLWVLPAGPHGGDYLLDFAQSLVGTTDPAMTVAAMLALFAVAHSGLAGLRTYAEPVVGPRAWRVLFALVSLPLALSCVSYFINHAHEGAHLWQWHDTELAHSILWITNFVSFLFLYPSTFNLLEIAAIQPPQLHLWETGVIRITRHPQAFGQLLWCLAHTAYLGTTTAVAASVMLLLHHGFACYHGDRRLQTRHGEDFEYIKSTTSIVPFQAILEGRQVLPQDYYKEWLRGPYLLIVGGTIGAYLAHPYLQAGAALLNW